ncbi:hypothetical protein C0389_06930 [bacterium]|nr:hypothetical protein [bacterium]
MYPSNRITNSMLWAAYGDALGFITELSDRNNLIYRTDGKDKVTELTTWKRKIGGPYGISINLPKGCYSDDTQLRLAVCRSINRNGKFDFETFSKIELPIFLSYGLGKGKGTKAACESLQKKSIQWNTNFFESKYSRYLDMGGNGAAMRIQPHVWAANDKVADSELISEIMRDTIITHGNPIAWIGAVFHGLVLQYTLLNGRCPHPEMWLSILEKSKCLAEICRNDNLLKDIWVPNWEKQANITLEDGIKKASIEMHTDIDKIFQILNEKENGVNSYKVSEELYHKLVQVIDGFNPSFSGSAIKTALLSSFIGYYFHKNPYDGIKICINSLGSDTDTIASMAGSLIGAYSDSEPPEEVLDYEYIRSQGERLYNIRQSIEVLQFNYPDLLYWKLPNSNLDYIGSFDDKVFLCGLGELHLEDQKYIQKQKNDIVIWQFAKTYFGQTVLISHRGRLKPLLNQMISFSTNNFKISSHVIEKESGAFMKKNQNEKFSSKKTINEITDTIIRNGFNESEIGSELLNFAKDEDGIEKAISFTSIIVKAKLARIRKEKSISK